MTSTVSKIGKRFATRSQAGQTIVIMALGFVALLGFVGIVTDVSLMFLNYSTLTRAIDSASVAAAGQVRRLVPNDTELATCVTFDADGSCPEAEGMAFGRSFANVGVAARQFLEFYGVNPKAVVVDMCFTVSTFDAGTNTLIAIPGLEADFAELCADKNSQRKLIRVTAQTSSPTVFLRLLGWSEITLEASAISETAVLDVVLILDVSESMLNQTNYQTWANAGYNHIYKPPVVDVNMANALNVSATTGYAPGDPTNDLFNESYLWYSLSKDGQELVNTRLNNAGSSPYYVQELNYPYATSYSGPNLGSTREACQVAFWPYSVSFRVPGSTSAAAGGDNLRRMYADAGSAWTVGPNWSGFTPTYNYYDCCNDPNGDGDFSDLICEPFREARDATDQFLQRIDFLRGDRVAFVTFDREAFLVRYQDTNNEITHMIESENAARALLRRSVGVRAEASFYEPQRTTVTINGAPTELAYLPWRQNADGTVMRSPQLDIHDYRVASSCPFHDAGMGFPYSYQSNPPAGYPTTLFPPQPNAQPDLLYGIMYPGNPITGSGGWENLKRNTANDGYQPVNSFYSYDMWASCRGTNIGAALREGSNALLDQRTTRTNGSVWVMVMLSDGAAAGSDPVFDGRNPTAPDDLYYPYHSPYTPVKYGGLGVCPPGPETSARSGIRGELIDVNDTKDTIDGSPSFPFCSDEIPESRHFCFDPSLRTNSDEPSWVDLSNIRHPDCRSYYDVDDYARDWADWIGLAEPPGLDNATEQRNAAQLPTIFTIGFGLNFAYGTNDCVEGQIAENPSNRGQNDIGDCLGEELLRYISDVGDNFTIDNDYQQDWLDDNQRNNSLADNEWGDRGACEDPTLNPVTAGSIVSPLPAGQSCGNYYNAPGGEQLQDVFDDIASRMFTRLTQ